MGMKKFAFKKTALYILTGLVLAVVIAMALIVYVPAFTAYADEEEESGVQVRNCVRLVPKDLENNEYASSSGVAVRDFNTDEIIFYLPESYYLSNVEEVHGRFQGHSIDYYTFSYMDFYFNMGEYSPCIDFDNNLDIREVVTFGTNENLYPDFTLTLREDGETIWLDSQTVLTNAFTIKFVGFGVPQEEGETPNDYFFISATKDGETKYTTVPKSLFVKSDVPYQTRAQEEREAILKRKESEPKAGDIVPNTSKALRIILIIGICIPAALIMFLLFKPTKDGRRKVVSKERTGEEFDYDEQRTYRRDDRRDSRDYRYEDRRYDDRDYRDSRDDRDYQDDRRNDRDRYRDDRRYDDRRYDDRRYDDRPRDDRRY